MADPTRGQLEQAYHLIQNDELEKAIVLLKPIVAAQPNNADAWWLLANAVSEPDEARRALENVLRLNPNHSKARELLNQLAVEFPEPATDSLFDSAAPVVSDEPVDELDRILGEQPEPVTASETDTNIDDLFSAEPSFGDLESQNLDDVFAGANREMDVLDENPFAVSSGEPDFLQALNEGADAEALAAAPAGKAGKVAKAKPAKVKEPPKPLDALEVERLANTRTSPAVRIALVLLIVIVIGGGATLAYLGGVFGNRGGGEVPTVPVTPVASAGTAATSEAGGELGSAIQATTDLFVASKFTDARTAIVASSFGDTLQVEVCGALGPGLQPKVNQAMDMAASQAAKIRGSVKAVGVQFVSCTRPDVTLYRAVAPIDAVTSYVDGGMQDQHAYRLTWKPA